MREVKLPPSTRFTTPWAISSGLARGEVAIPARITDCTEPGRSTT